MDYKEEGGVAVLDAPGSDYGTATKKKSSRFTPEVLRELGRGVKPEEIVYKQSTRE